MHVKCAENPHAINESSSVKVGSVHWRIQQSGGMCVFVLVLNTCAAMQYRTENTHTHTDKCTTFNRYNGQMVAGRLRW